MESPCPSQLTLAKGLILMLAWTNQEFPRVTSLRGLGGGKLGGENFERAKTCWRVFKLSVSKQSLRKWSYVHIRTET